MRFQKVAILMVGSTMLFSGCAQRQYQRGNQTRTYQRSPVYHTPSENSVTPERHYQADPPVKQLMDHPREPSGPSQPVPAPPAVDVSLGKVKGVSYSRSTSQWLHGGSCASEPVLHATPSEGCQSSYKTRTKSYFSKSADFFKRLCPKKKVACVVEESCGDFKTAIEGCVKRKSYFPKYKKGLISGLFDKCIGKKYCPVKSPCVPADDGCGSGLPVAAAEQTWHSETATEETSSPLSRRLEDPFEQPVARPAVPAVPVAPRPVPDVPEEDVPAPPAAPAKPDQPGQPTGVENVPPLPATPKGLDPVPEAKQTYVEPPAWPKLRVPASRVANVPASQTSWQTNPPSWQSNPPSWHRAAGQQGQWPQPIQSNVSPWSTSWQVR